MFEPSKELAVLKGLLNQTPSGAYLTYFDIEQKTNIKMDSRGKSILRSALRSVKREYRCNRSEGIELESPHNAMHLVTNRVKRVSNSLKKADKTTSRMAERYIDSLKKDDLERLLMTASLFGAIKTMAKGLSNIYKPMVKLTKMPASIPDFRK